MKDSLFLRLIVLCPGALAGRRICVCVNAYLNAPHPKTASRVCTSLEEKCDEVLDREGGGGGFHCLYSAAVTVVTGKALHTALADIGVRDCR